MSAELEKDLKKSKECLMEYKTKLADTESKSNKEYEILKKQNEKYEKALAVESKKNEKLEKEKNKLKEIKSIKEQKGEVIDCSNEIEELLVVCGADKNIDFLDKINFLKNDLDNITIDKLHMLRKYRNKVAHNKEKNLSNFDFFYNNYEVVKCELIKLKEFNYG